MTIFVVYKYFESKLRNDKDQYPTPKIKLQTLRWKGGFYASTPKEQRARKSIDFIKNMNSQLNSICGMSITLKQAGVKEGQLEETARKSLNDGAMILYPEDMGASEVLSVLKKAY